MFVLRRDFAFVVRNKPRCEWQIAKSEWRYTGIFDSMSGLSDLFLKRIAQTSATPALVEVERASGIHIYDTQGKEYVDLNSGYCVSALGHCHPKVVAAVQEQAGSYMHTSVYGEHVQSPQVRLAQLLTAQLDASLDTVFFCNSGAEAVEGAMKLAKRATGRYEIVACRNAYHGSTQGADSLRSDLDYIGAFLPLLPGIRHMRFNEVADLDTITKQTACVIMEPVQAEAGVRLPSPNYLKAVRERCDETGALLVLDEIQTGMGRTGKFCAHQHHGVAPDILLLAKALGAGLPLGAIISRHALLHQFTHDPSLGHLTTFGGNPVSCAAALAALEVMLETHLVDAVEKKATHLVAQLQHPAIHEIRHSGLLMGIDLRKPAEPVVRALAAEGIITDHFLFDPNAFRIAPPLIISEQEIGMICERILRVLDKSRR